MSKIKEALQKQFQDHRVIFWYDSKEEFRDNLEELEISGVEKLEVKENEFEIKYKVSRENPQQKFLLYFAKEKPTNEDNWLLDLELAHHIFHTDREAMILQELGLDYHLKELISEHIEFFKSRERNEKFKELIAPGDEHHALRCKMLAVVFNTPTTSLVNFVHSYAGAVVSQNRNYEKELERFDLKGFFWSEIERVYNYRAEKPTIYDFLLDVFDQNSAIGSKLQLSKESRLIISTWKNTLPYRNYFSEVSGKIANDLSVDEKLNDAALEDVIDEDLFELTDKKIIYELKNQILADGINADKVNTYIKKRENKFWFEEHKDLFLCVQEAANLISLVKKLPSEKSAAFTDALRAYTSRYYEVDMVYRKFIWSYRQAKHNSVLSDLADKVEKVYSNDWLLSYNNNWQKKVDVLEKWPVEGPLAQRGFFKYHIKPFLEKKQKIFVIISDALRYECGVELQEILKSENRFDARLEHLISSLPSYTQLGMASLLPHSEIKIKEKGDAVLVDEIPASGLPGRTKILEANSGVRATAVKADELMKMNTKQEGREFAKSYDLIYIYHNRIDKTGDDKVTEEKVFDAVEEELQYLLDLCKKIAALNGTNILITADHGFIYQNLALENSDFSLSQHTGDIWKENRRFVIGKNLKGDTATRSFSAAALGLDNDDVEILIPKSINRLRVKGAGSRFVHGGATPQEVILPLLKVAYKRADTVKQVEIDIIKSTDRITTNILPVSFIQSAPVTDKVLPRSIRAGLYAEDGELLSDLFQYNFDAEAGSERQREEKYQFHLSKKASGAYKNQRVKLILEEPVENSNKWKLYKEFYYTLNITFSNDFD